MRRQTRPQEILGRSLHVAIKALNDIEIILCDIKLGVKVRDRHAHQKASTRVFRWQTGTKWPPGPCLSRLPVFLYFGMKPGVVHN